MYIENISNYKLGNFTEIIFLKDFLKGDIVNEQNRKILDSDFNNEIILKYDLNEITLENLVKLKGIGPKLAKKIISKREELGYFSTLRELLSVSGIKEQKFKQIKDFFYIK